jgi:hypothetical protein
MTQTSQHLLDSLVTYHFVPVIDKKWSHVGLFKEYARRMAWWADHLGAVNNWLITNIAYVLELDEELDIVPLQQLDAHLQTQNLNDPMPALLQSALMFAMVSDHGMIKQVELENPYEVLVKLYTRGGAFRWNQRGFWEISGSFGVNGMEMATYKVSEPFISLNDEELDLVDNGDKESNMSSLF